MSVRVNTTKPKTLLASVKQAIDDKKIETWEYDSDGDFTHSPEQWKNKAWLRPVVESGCLVLKTIKPKDKTLTKVVYAVYHGRFIEMLLTHFDSDFSTAVASAQAADGDTV